MKLELVSSKIENADCYINGPYKIIHYKLSNGNTISIQPEENGIGVKGLVPYNEIPLLLKILDNYS